MRLEERIVRVLLQSNGNSLKHIWMRRKRRMRRRRQRMVPKSFFPRVIQRSSVRRPA
ncbi:hypothetical protein E2C01_101960 [Portunus trituberculatus]|uniref:Uncharacterized protein n=1 Tax=Portunus trituberculatus TaxID=210409 RepID=A0A5B7KLG6_PORTR|nr:hypothetical protein [Portunus trituberculatus]